MEEAEKRASIWDGSDKQVRYEEMVVIYWRKTKIFHLGCTRNSFMCLTVPAAAVLYYVCRPYDGMKRKMAALRLQDLKEMVTEEEQQARREQVEGITKREMRVVTEHRIVLDQAVMVRYGHNNKCEEGRGG